jgi:transcription elongation factor Elf1
MSLRPDPLLYSVWFKCLRCGGKRRSEVTIKRPKYGETLNREETYLLKICETCAGLTKEQIAQLKARNTP